PTHSHHLPDALPISPATGPQHGRSGTDPHPAYACRNSENPLITSFPGCFHIFTPRVCKDFLMLQVIANVTSPCMPATGPGSSGVPHARPPTGLPEVSHDEIPQHASGRRYRRNHAYGDRVRW